MLKPEQVKPFITHSDILVSNAAIRYFSESYRYDDGLMPLVLEKLHQVKKDETFYLHYAYHFPQTADSVAELVEMLRSDAIDMNTKHQLAQIMINSDANLLEPRIPELSRNNSAYAKIAEEKVRIARMPDERLLGSFEQFLNDIHGKEFNTSLHTYGTTLVRELGKRGLVNADRIIDALASHDENVYESYDDVYYTDLAGFMRLEAAIPYLCGFLSIEDDGLLYEQSIDALVRIGTVSVIDQLAEQYERKSEGYFRLYASSVFGRIKLQASEVALLKLLPLDQELTYATKLADGLCELGSAQGIAAVAEMVENGYDDGYLDLRESLYANCIMNGVDLPKLRLWRAKIAEEERRRLKRTEMLNSSGEKLFGKRFSFSQPYVNSSKVGRNDPCPCGSGKKYKKCCAN